MYVGDEAWCKRGILTLKYPIENGMIENWDDIEQVWYHTFYNELRCSSEEYPVFLTEPACGWPRKTRERVTQIMFESFDCPAFYLANSAPLSLYATGRTTGLVVDSGDSRTDSISVYEGHPLPHSCFSSSVSGRGLTSLLAKLLSERGYEFTTTAEIEIVRDIKEKLCFVALDFEDKWRKYETSPLHETEYEMPDGQILSVGSERFRCPEALFQPSMVGEECSGKIHEIACQSVFETDQELEGELFRNVVLSGGSTMFDGFENRLQKEMSLLGETHVKVVAAPERRYSVWIGASILSSLSTFPPMLIAKEEYDEFGPCIVQRKCF